MFARICPAAMIFVPSKNGLSHNPDEFTSQEEIENGANVLLQMMIQVAGLNHG
jgi:N-carbamoyl-L-amino-acid hydrolase